MINIMKLPIEELLDDLVDASKDLMACNIGQAANMVAVDLMKIPLTRRIEDNIFQIKAIKIEIIRSCEHGIDIRDGS